MGKKLFDVTSWRFFKPSEFVEQINRKDFFVTYVLAHDSGYDKDIFVFPVAVFDQLIKNAITSGEKKKVYISRSKEDPDKWFLRKQRKIEEINETSCIDVSEYRRNFKVLS